MSSAPNYPDLSKVGPSAPPESPPGPGYNQAGGTGGFVPPYPDAPPAYQESTPLQPQSQPQALGQPVTQYTTVVVTEASFGPQPGVAFCPKCAQQITTRVTKKAGLFSWLMCLGLCMVGCDCGCCLVPCCADSCMDTEHRCPSCKQFLGVDKRC